jgi:dihydroxy-acid dehydratase
MTLDIAMGGSTNTVLHSWPRRMRRARLHHGRYRPLSRKVPCSARSRRPRATSTWRMSTAPAASWRILGELDRAGLIHRECPTVHAATLGDALERWDITRTNSESVRMSSSRPPRAACRPRWPSPRIRRWDELDTRPDEGRHPLCRDSRSPRMAASPFSTAISPRRLHREDGRRRREILKFTGPARFSKARTPPSRRSCRTRSSPATSW